MSNKIKREIYQEVNDSLNIVDVAVRLGATNLTKRGNSLVGNCPTKHPSKSGTPFNLDYTRNQFNCFGCKEVKGIGSIHLVYKVTGMTIPESIKWLVKEFNLNIDPNQTLNIPKQTLKEKQEQDELITRSFLLNEIVERGKELLYKEEGKEALDYLVNQRKYDPEVLKNSDWFYLPEDYDVKKMLIDGDEDKRKFVPKLKLQGHYGDNFRLAFPYRNAEGLITGFLKRSTEPSGSTITTYDNKVHDNVRWDSTPGLKKDDLFGIDKVDKKEDTLIVVEGYPDVLYLQALGVNNVVAVGQGMLGKRHLNELKIRKIKHLIIVFDNDGVGPSNTREAIKLILKHTSIVPFVVDPKKFGMHKDPDEYLKANGLDDLMQKFQETDDGVFWVINELISGASVSNALSKRKAKEEVLDFLSIVNNDVTISEILPLLKKSFGEDVGSLRKQLKALEKDYTDELEDHITNDPVVPMYDMTSDAYGYYDAEEDVPKLGIERNKIIELLKDHGIKPPQNFPHFRVKFMPQDLGGKFDIYNRKFNLFTPTEFMFYEKNDEKIELEVACPRTFYLLRNVIPVENEREHFINWLSYVFTTRQKVDTTWLFQGLPGAGKNLFFDKIIKPLFGEKQTIVVDDDRLQSDFNGYMSNKLFVAFNEVANDETTTKRSVKSKLKSLISEHNMIINEKFLRAYEATNDANMFFFSNEALPMLIEKYDRRFNVIETGDALNIKPTFNRNPEDFIKSLGNELPKFAQYLYNYKSDKHKVKIVLENEAKATIKELSMNRFELFADKLKTNDWEWFDINYPEKGNDFLGKDNRRGLMTEDMLKAKKVEREILLGTFNRLFDGLTSKTKFTQQMKLRRINVDRKQYSDGRDDEYFYEWK